MDRAKMQAIRAAVNAALEGIEMDGVQLSLGRGSFTEKFGSFKLEVSDLGEDGIPETKDTIAWPIHAPLNGLGDMALGDEFTFRGETFSVRGWNTWAPKYPVQAVRVTDGKRFKFPARSVAAGRKQS